MSKEEGRVCSMGGCAPPPIQMLREWEGRSSTVQDRRAYPPQAAGRKRAQWVCANLNTQTPHFPHTWCMIHSALPG